MSESYVVVTVSFFATGPEHAADVVRDMNAADWRALETAGFAVDRATVDGAELEGWNR